MSTITAPSGSGLAAERHARRDVVHTAVLGLLWLLVPVLWWRVIGRTSTDLLLLSAVFVVASLLVNVSATTLWVEHNLRIFLEKGPRTGPSATPIVYDRDWVGRIVDADWATIADAREVVVSVAGAAKGFAAAPPITAAPWSTPAPALTAVPPSAVPSTVGTSSVAPSTSAA